MSDGKRRRFRKNKQQEEKRPVILAKREAPAAPSSSGSQRQIEAEIHPKILLKTKDDFKTTSSYSSSSNALATSPHSELIAMQQVPQKTIIVTRSEAALSPSHGSSMSPNTNKEIPSAAAELPTAQQQQQLQQPQLVEPTPQMTRPATLISSTGFINSSVRKLLLKSNTDFLVVGVIGMQGVGKSTIMNLLANEELDYDYYNKVFVEEDSIFPTKLKLHKCSARSRTESTHMFITKERIILLDSPPVLCNSYKKDMITNELDDIRNIITFLSVCHLVIVVQDDYFNMNFMRLLQFAELMKPAQDNKPFVSDYFPNILYVKNRAKRQDFMPGQKERMDRMLKCFFKDSQLRIYLGQTVEQQRLRKWRVPEAERVVNSILLPEVKAAEATSFHVALKCIVEELRNLVFMTPRSEMYAGSSELTEAIWFELLTLVSADNQQFLFNTYEEIHRKNLDIGNSASNTSSGVATGTGINSSKETHDVWSDK